MLERTVQALQPGLNFSSAPACAAESNTAGTRAEAADRVPGVSPRTVSRASRGRMPSLRLREVNLAARYPFVVQLFVVARAEVRVQITADCYRITICDKNTFLTDSQPDPAKLAQQLKH